MLFFKIADKKRLAVLFSSVIIFAMVFGVAFSGAPALTASAAKKKLPIYSVGREESDKRISISFDAAWGNEDTQELIDILAKYDVKATFFCVAQWVEKYPESVKALSEAGHEVMNHSSTHPHMSKLSKTQMISEIEGCNDKIEAVTGVRPVLFRAPYGEYNDLLIDTLTGQGMYCIQWDVDSLDWKDIPSSEITRRVTQRVRPGSIVLFHNAAKNTPAALPSIIESLQSQGYEFVKISDNIIREDFYLDHEGRQWKNVSD